MLIHMENETDSQIIIIIIFIWILISNITPECISDFNDGRKYETVWLKHWRAFVWET